MFSQEKKRIMAKGGLSTKKKIMAKGGMYSNWTPPVIILAHVSKVNLQSLVCNESNFDNFGAPKVFMAGIY